MNNSYHSQNLKISSYKKEQAHTNSKQKKKISNSNHNSSSKNFCYTSHSKQQYSKTKEKPKKKQENQTYIIKKEKNFYQTKFFYNLVYSILITLTLALLISPVSAEICASDGKFYNKWSYGAVKAYRFPNIFDKMGFWCRAIKRRCWGEEYEALELDEKKFFDIWNQDREYGDYFSLIPKYALDYFLCRISNDEKPSSLVYDSCPSILRCTYQNATRQFCLSSVAKELSKCINNLA